MFKKIAIAAPMAVLALSSSMAFAADEMRSTINIKATIPTSIFHAQPSNANPDFGKDETMNYNLVSGELGSLRAVYDVKHSDPKGSIHAFVEGGQTAATLYSGKDAIPLTVTFNGVELSEAAQEVVNAVVSYTVVSYSEYFHHVMRSVCCFERGSYEFSIDRLNQTLSRGALISLLYAVFAMLVLAEVVRDIEAVFEPDSAKPHKNEFTNKTVGAGLANGCSLGKSLATTLTAVHAPSGPWRLVGLYDASMPAFFSAVRVKRLLSSCSSSPMSLYSRS